MIRIKTYLLLLLLVIPSLAGAQSRDPFLQPFTSDSPWNTPIGDDAKYQAIKGIEKYYGGVNYNDRWTTGIHQATKQDTPARLYIYGPKIWSLLDSDEVKPFGNPPKLEEELRQASKSTNEFAANYYATIVKTPPGQRTWPKDVRDINTGWTNIIYMPKDARPSPDSDAHLAVFQPNNLVLECYGAVVCSNGDVICSIAGFTDPRSEGTGSNNGRLASLLNNYAGIIRKGEVTNGRIPHCLNATCSRLLLTTKAT
ncbi:MAG: hypothetical protein PF692_06955 [Kiritimatiellae bacterium]|jgi:hypothetical protein|nr:hypothetical protein [Kiritimatiellia bacterium]